MERQPKVHLRLKRICNAILLQTHRLQQAGETKRAGFLKPALKEINFAVSL